jgi:hypothetical protein
MNNGCPYSMRVPIYAASKGHLHILKWWLIKCNEMRLHLKSQIWHKKICSEAALNGYFEVLKWARENNCLWDWRTTYYAKDRHEDIYNWAVENGCEEKEMTKKEEEEDNDSFRDSTDDSETDDEGTSIEDNHNDNINDDVGFAHTSWGQSPHDYFLIEGYSSSSYDDNDELFEEQLFSSLTE